MIAVLAYHSVQETDFAYAVSPEDFERQMKILKRRFRVITLAELRDILVQGRMPPDRCATITFDDGFEDNLTQALPILKELGLPATLFLTTSYVGRTITTPSGFTSSCLDWNQARQLDQSGIMDIQSHGHGHLVLTQATEAQAVEDLERGKASLEAELKKNIFAYAYPKARCNDTMKSVVAGYFDMAFAGDGLITDLKVCDRWRIPRIVVRNHTPDWKFRARLSPLAWRLKSFL